MKIKALVKGNILILERPIRVRQPEIEVDVPEDYIQVEVKGESKTFSEAIWDTIGKLPEADVQWRKEWHKHLDEKYNG